MIPSVISELGYNEKLHLVWELWDSLAADESKVPVSEEDKTEIRRRLELYRKGELTADTWENVRAKVVANRR